MIWLQVLDSRCGSTPSIEEVLTEWQVLWLWRLLWLLCHPHLFDESTEFDVCQRLGQAICNYLVRGHIRELNSIGR